jgi:hypothetical protein
MSTPRTAAHRQSRTADPLGRLDGYESAHLVAHLASAGDTDRLRRLLALEDADGEHAWSNHRQSAEEDQGLLDDLDLAASFAFGVGRIGLSIGWSLMRASLTGIANRAPVDLVVARVRCGALPLTPAITAALDRSPVTDRARLLGQLGAIALEEGRLDAADMASHGALEAVIEVGVDADGLLLFEEIVAQLAPSALNAAAELARRGEQPARAARALRLVAGRLRAGDGRREALLRDSFALARRTRDPLLRALALAELGQVAPTELRRAGTEAIAAVLEERDEHYRARAVGQMADLLAPELLEELWETASEWPTWILEGGRWMVREHAACGIAPAAAAGGLVELALAAAGTIEEASWATESQIALLRTAAALPSPADAHLLTRLADVLDESTYGWARLLRVAVEREQAADVARRVAEAYADKAYDFWRQGEGFESAWSIDDDVVERSLTETTPVAEPTLPALTDVQRRIDEGTPEEGAAVAIAAAAALPPMAARAVLEHAQERFVHIADTAVLQRMRSALHAPPPTALPAQIEPPTPPVERHDPKLAAAVAEAIALPNRERMYDQPSQREEALEVLLPRLLEAGMFSVYVDAAEAIPARWSYVRAERLLPLVEHGAIDVALEAFGRLSGWAHAPVLTEAVEQMPTRLWDRWLHCLAEIPAESQAEPIEAAGRRTLSPVVLERLAGMAFALTDADARASALEALVANWTCVSRDDPRSAQRVLQALLRAGSRLSRLQLADDLDVTAPAVSPLLSATDLDDLTTITAQVQRWWP